MCDSEIEQIVAYLSIKLNTIFCYKEFVASVREDLQQAICSCKKENKCCILVFPVLGPIFLKAVRYQAKVLNLVTFWIGSGPRKTLAVCLKDHCPTKKLSSRSNEVPSTMSDDSQGSSSSSKKKAIRPSQQLYIPPAQRRQQKETKKSSSREVHDKLNCVNGDEDKSKQDVSCDNTSAELGPANDVPAQTKGNAEPTPAETDDISTITSGVCSNQDDDKTVSSLKDLDLNNKLIIKTNKPDDEVDKEKEEMRRATEKINRKSRSIIKYIDSSDTLKIEIDAKADGKPATPNLTNWEDLFDENGELQEPYFGEIVKHVGTEVTILKTNEDYSPYQNKALQDLDHVIELYDFPSSFKTHDIIQLYSQIQSDTMYIKWVDDTHALLVLGTPAQAQRALQIENDIIKSRPISEASSVSQAVAFKHDLKPAMKRPQTSLQTARRMINTHLGTKCALSKEIMEKERRLLQEAREQRRQEKQSERDAWDGNPRPSTA